MATRPAIPGALIAAVRAMSVAGFLAVVSAVAATSGPIGWASWRRAGLGWRFWMGLGTMGAAVAAMSLVACLSLAAWGHSHPKGRVTRLDMYALLNLATLALLLFVPAVNAV